MRHLLALLILLLASCGSPAVSYYMLTPEGSAPSGGGRGIGVGPVALASHLDRANLVFQQSENRLAVAESHHWAGRLEENIAHVLAADLGRDLHTGNIRVYPWHDDAGLSYQIAVDVNHLEGAANGDAVLEATWRVYALPERSLRITRSWSDHEPLHHDGYDELVAAESRLLARLATQIAAGLQR